MFVLFQIAQGRLSLKSLIFRQHMQNSAKSEGARVPSSLGRRDAQRADVGAIVSSSERKVF